MMFGLVILCLVVSVERQACQALSGSPNFNKKERKFSERICIQYVSVLAYGLHRGQNTLPHDELPLGIHQSCIGKNLKPIVVFVVVRKAIH
jgi:hypothetical protein